MLVCFTQENHIKAHVLVYFLYLPDRNCSMNFVRTHACCTQTCEITARFLRALAQIRAKLRQFAREKRRELQSHFQRWHGKIYLYLREERQPVLAEPYCVESRAFLSISRQTACTRTVGIPREIVRSAAFLREDTRSRGYARNSRSRILSLVVITSLAPRPPRPPSNAQKK